MMSSLYALKMSAEVIIAVLQRALLGFFRDFKIKEITSLLFIRIRSHKIGNLPNAAKNNEITH